MTTTTAKASARPSTSPGRKGKRRARIASQPPLAAATASRTSFQAWIASSAAPLTPAP